MDTVDKKKRSEIMRKIQSRDSEIEIDIRKRLWSRGLRYRKNSLTCFGKPDLVNKAKKIAIFVDSCFWHACKKHCRMPSSNKKYWIEKIKRNQTRDITVNKHYKKLGWKILRFWEHDLKNTAKIMRKIEKSFLSQLTCKCA